MDDRFQLLERWLATRSDGRRFRLAPASADASFRRYFRVGWESGDGPATCIAMDAPPAQEDCRPFVKVAGLLRDAGLNAPEVLASDFGQGFLLLTDLGTRTYLEELNEGNATALFGDAIDALVIWQLASREGVLPAYDEAVLRRELALFPEWYVGRHLGVQLSAGQIEGLEGVFSTLVRACLAQPRVYVHRDYMPRNLMVCDPNPGILDFQDALHGPITYDVVCLFRDAFISWQEERVLDWSVRYWERARKAGLPVHADFAEFWRDLEWMGLQRHLKVLGIFARLTHRDGKPRYVADTPRFIAYARAVATRYSPLAPLARLLDELDKVPAPAVRAS
ncbi:MAG: aminoglycoside phosphotransferase [Betaproteobacteria bacterium]|nr:aminoglycoside phosphotransferase [Betaproteobacteria bacterium]